jgi:hypothetical protein
MLAELLHTAVATGALVLAGNRGARCGPLTLDHFEVTSARLSRITAFCAQIKNFGDAQGGVHAVLFDAEPRVRRSLHAQSGKRQRSAGATGLVFAATRAGTAVMRRPAWRHNGSARTGEARLRAADGPLMSAPLRFTGRNIWSYFRACCPMLFEHRSLRRSTACAGNEPLCFFSPWRTAHSLLSQLPCFAWLSGEKPWRSCSGPAIAF